MHAFNALTLASAMVSFLLAFVTSFFAWPEIVVIFVVLGYYFSFYVVAQSIGESEGWHHQALKFYCIILAVIIIVFAVLYWRYGLVQNGEKVDISFFTSIYFSITTWTTLGYGDFSPVERIRHITSVQAILGYVSLGILITLASGYMNNMATSRKEVREHNAKLIKEQNEDLIKKSSDTESDS
ncbi:MAG: potassium channel family protein [Thalassolituus sp.]|uniref:potassium channel family protein n=1 Tax=Thalassolituus sp. TaxID=2030822 RepID=UPI00398194D8